MSKKTIILPSLFEKLNKHLEKHSTLYFYFSLGFTLLFGLLLYDPRVSLSGDDSTYILNARDFCTKFQFPGFQGPLYPMVISVIVMIFGISLFPLKIFSLLSIAGFIYFTYKAFRNRIPAILLFSMLILVAINSHILYYGSQTYNDAFYLFIQSIFILVFFRYFIDEKEEKISWKTDIKRHIFLALCLMGVSLTRSIGMALVIAVVVYFLFYRKWKNACMAILFFTIFLFAFQGIKSTVWDSSGFQITTQGSALTNKDYYHPEYGQEDISGYFNRLLGNSDQYLSRDLFSIMGLRKATPGVPLKNYPFLAVLMYAIAIGVLFFTFKKSRYIFFITVMTGCFLLVTFTVLQVFWGQERLIIPSYPYLLLIIFSFLYYWLNKEKFRSIQWIIVIPFVILFFSGISDTFKNISEVRKLKNEYSGLSSDWRNYMQASRWIGENLKENEVAACRKPSISMIYSGGKDFHGIYSVPSENFDTFLKKWEQNPGNYAAYLIDNKLTNESYYTIQKQYYAGVSVGNLHFMIVQSPDSINKDKSLQNIQFIQSPEQMKQLAEKANNQVSLTYADSLLTNLSKNNVTHVLTANLRINPDAKTGQIISTVERYVYYIQEKYPYLFTVEKQIGADNDEPARILKIQWESIKENQ